MSILSHCYAKRANKLLVASKEHQLSPPIALRKIVQSSVNFTELCHMDDTTFGKFVKGIVAKTVTKLGLILTGHGLYFVFNTSVLCQKL